jgi:hypothetical protein
MNIDILKPANYDVKLHFAQLKLGPLIDIPTQYKKHSSTLIDHVYASSKKLTGFVMEADISDHYTVGLHTDQFQKTKQERSREASMQLLLGYLKQYLRCQDWSTVLNDNTINAFSTFELILAEAYNLCCPVTSKTLKTRPLEPWFTPGLLKSRYTKEKYHRIARKKNTVKTWDIFHKYRNVYKRIILTAKILYYGKEFTKRRSGWPSV